ncbi:hypothetical protein WG66_014774, partial [Moniliophthora roreri]
PQRYLRFLYLEDDFPINHHKFTADRAVKDKKPRRFYGFITDEQQGSTTWSRNLQLRNHGTAAIEFRACTSRRLSGNNLSPPAHQHVNWASKQLCRETIHRK